ncbi:MAG: Gldg family protein [Deltaproteobacteria bacterium]|nr:Gldg family protein [Deltaproteobacteria bacterium]
MIWLALSTVVVSLALILLDIQPLWVQFVAFGIAITFFIMALLPMLPQPERTKYWFRKRALLLGGLAVLAVLNLMARRYDHVFDFSKSRIYSLREETLNWISKVEEPVRILAFMRSDDKTFAYAEWLQKEIDRKSSKIQIEIKNINQEVLLAKNYDVEQAGETVLLSGDHWIKVNRLSEEMLVQGLIRLLSKGSSTLCFVVGHGEPDIEEAAPEGLGAAKQFLSGLGYRVRAISLTETASELLLQTCGLLLVVSPRSSFLPEEETRLREILDSPVPILLALDPVVPSALVSILRERGIELSGDLVINRMNLRQRRPLTDLLLVTYEGGGRITRDLRRGLYLPQVQSLNLISKEGGILWSPLIQTPPDDSIRLLGKEKVAGPFLLAATGVVTTPKLLVFGTGKAFLSRHLGYVDNRALLINALRWLLGETEIAEDIRFDAEERRMDLDPATQGWVRGFSFYGLPGFALLLSLLLWLRRYWGR